MPDIAMCADQDCPSRQRCYRFTAQPSFAQAYGSFTREPGADRCASFWPVKDATEDLIALSKDDDPALPPMETGNVF